MKTINKSNGMAYRRFSQWHFAKRQRFVVACNPLHAGGITSWTTSKEHVIPVDKTERTREEVVARIPSMMELESIAIDPPQEWLDEPKWE